jgi:hypothetical protein
MSALLRTTHIIDTAGLREASDEVERIGIERAWQEIEQADRVRPSVSPVMSALLRTTVIGNAAGKRATKSGQMAAAAHPHRRHAAAHHRYRRFA